MMRRPALALLSLPLLLACDVAPDPGAASPIEAERRAYQAALDASDASAIALDIAAIALAAMVEVDADRRAATCKGSGVELQACQHREAKEAEDNGAPFASSIDEASKLQLEVRAFLLEYQRCAPIVADRFCQANAIAKASAKSPAVKQAVDEARRRLRNVKVRPAH